MLKKRTHMHLNKNFILKKLFLKMNKIRKILFIELILLIIKDVIVNNHYVKNDTVNVIN